MKIIEDEHRKGQLPLAANLKRVLDATRGACFRGALAYVLRGAGPED